MPFSSKNTDADPAVPLAEPTAEITLATQRTAAGLQKQAAAALNQAPPPALFDPVTKAHYFLAAPAPLKQLFAPPLATRGKSANIQAGKRRVSQGWGAARDSGYRQGGGGPSVMNRRHAGLDFPGDLGEAVLASADGRVTFIGVQLRARQRLELREPSVLANGDVVGTVEGRRVTVPAIELGHGGLYVEILHNGDFQNYMTQYMHLGGVPPTLKRNDAVTQGDVIGLVGTTGGSSAGQVTSGPHVHWQVHYHQALVKPEELVDFYMPGYQRDAQARLFTGGVGDPAITTGTAIAQRDVAGKVQAIARHNNTENQSYADFKSTHSAYYTAVGTKLSGDGAKAIQALATFEHALPKVEDALAFDFDKGLWNDRGGVPPKAGEGF